MCIHSVIYSGNILTVFSEKQSETTGGFELLTFIYMEKKDNLAFYYYFNCNFLWILCLWIKKLLLAFYPPLSFSASVVKLFGQLFACIELDDQ